MLNYKDFQFVLGVLERTVTIQGFDGAMHRKLMEDQDRAYEIMKKAESLGSKSQPEDD